MEHELQSLEADARKSLHDLTDEGQLEEFRIRFLGRKGSFSTIMRQLGTVPTEDRPRVGQLANTIKAKVDPCMSEVFPWRDIPRAHEKMQKNQHKPGNMAVLVQASRPGMRTLEEGLEGAP
jgi:phenylalanyl-tRNA synthetase alpha subunit